MGGSAALVVAMSSVVAVPELAAQAAPQKVILDTDGDGDYDALVSLMLAAVCPEIDLRGVVVTGSDRERSAGMVTKALRLMGRPEVGVYRGEPPTSPPPSFDYLRSRRSRGTA
jgi:inosine-uridine nucleoside N-ribohydrolase